jgi:tetraacyldisaccharide-1-P 4'-kinase
MEQIQSFFKTEALMNDYKSKNDKVLMIEKPFEFNFCEVGDEAILLSEVAPTCVAKNRFLASV